MARVIRLIWTHFDVLILYKEPSENDPEGARHALKVDAEEEPIKHFPLVMSENVNACIFPREVLF